MANFSYSDYQNVIAKAQSNDNGGSSTKIGFFKMKNDQDEALVRINVSSLNDLQFATVHQLGAAQKWMKISCLNPVGSYYDTCPLCAAVTGGAKDIGKAAKKVYVQMLVSYKDAATGQYSAAIPVIWERPAGFSTEVATLLRDYGDLTQRVFKVTRNGAAGNMKTTYSISYIPIFDKPESVPTDFSAFVNFNIAKHSFWEKTAGEIQVFLNTGSFPEPARAPQAPTPTDAEAPAYTKPVYNESYVAPAMPNTSIPQAPTYQPPVAPIFTTPEAPATAPTAAPEAPATAPTTPVTPVTPVSTTPAQPESQQPIGSEFGRAPRSFGGIAF